MLTAFSIIVLGYLVGAIEIKGIKLGNSAVLLVALVFGHFGFEYPELIKNLGLILFVSTVGLTAGPMFFKTLKSKAYAFLTAVISIIISGGVISWCCVKFFDIPLPIMSGIFTGALTSTPGLGAAMDSLNDPSIAAGYGIAYPFGVVGVVLFVQLVPKVLNISIADEVQKLESNFIKEDSDLNKDQTNKKLLVIDSSGMLIIGLTAIIGIALGNLTIPLFGKATISLGMAGGPLFAGIFIGSIRNINRISFAVSSSVLDSMRELGIVFFLGGAGVQAGAGFMNILAQYGVMLFVIGALITVIPMLLSFVILRKCFKMNVLMALGSICGGMTSTPSLGALVSMVNTDIVVSSYASTYPAALILIVLIMQVIL